MAHPLPMASQDSALMPAPDAVLCPLEEIPEGGCRELIVGAAPLPTSLLLWRHEGSVRAYRNVCPHFSVPLNGQPGRKFFLLSDSRVMCAWHCAVFRLEDGYCLEGPAQGLSLESLPTRVEAGQVILAGSA
jgi:nitrite reductase/ring-hydroxylating ferredoxin subunit